jgi:hypothetical protein
MENIYETYGKLMVEFEILQSRITECKRLIADDINKNKESNTEIKK